MPVLRRIPGAFVKVLEPPHLHVTTGVTAEWMKVGVGLVRGVAGVDPARKPRIREVGLLADQVTPSDISLAAVYPQVVVAPPGAHWLR